MTDKEKIELLEEHFTNELGHIDLSGLDFGRKILKLEGVKARFISNRKQQADWIDNNMQVSETWIDNSEQKAESRIINNEQRADGWISNDKQEAKIIINENQEAGKIHS